MYTTTNGTFVVVHHATTILKPFSNGIPAHSAVAAVEARSALRIASEAAMNMFYNRQNDA